MWFLADDFAWLGLRLQIHSAADCFTAVFQPQAQGTIRFLSERLFFLVFSSIFGVNALPFHIFAFATWCADLTLAAIIGARLTHSNTAGFLAAILWSAHAALVRPIFWASSYNEVLYAFCLLMAFYARLRWLDEGSRRWIAAEWAAYLAGFGALEMIVVYPALAALHAICCTRKRLASTLPLFIPAAIFTVAHLFLIPKEPGAFYVIALDRRIVSTFLHYLNQALAPARIADVSHAWLTWVRFAAILTAAALCAFAMWQSRNQNRLGWFCIGWFVVALSPVLSLPNHLTEYYVMLPVLGFAWLAGWAISTVWTQKTSFAWLARLEVVVLVAAYLIGSCRAINIYANWLDASSTRIRDVFEAAQEVEENHPGNTILLTHVDTELYGLGFDSRPFRLAGLNLRIAPGDEVQIQASDPQSLDAYVISPAKALDLLDHGRARVLDVSSSPMRDITRSYSTLLHQNPEASRRDFVDAGDPEYFSQLGPEGAWFGNAAGFQWMAPSGTVKLSGIRPEARTLYVTGFNPGAEFSRDPVTLRFTGNRHPIGSQTIIKPGDRFSFSLPLPPELRGVADIDLKIDMDRIIRRADSDQQYGIIFGTFAIR